MNLEWNPSGNDFFSFIQFFKFQMIIGLSNHFTRNTQIWIKTQKLNIGLLLFMDPGETKLQIALGWNFVENIWLP